MADKGGFMRVESGPAQGVLVVCTANRCRSVMAGALLARRLGAAGVAGWVRSAGLLGTGQPASLEAVSVMASYGLDVSRHRSRLMTADELGAASLVLAMAREHVRHAVVTGWVELPRLTPWPDDCTSSWAVAEYCFASVSDRARLTANPSRTNTATHHFRRRRVTR